MTSLWFEQLESGDRVSVNPHASPVLHAINFLLGELDEKYLPTLRTFGGYFGQVGSLDEVYKYHHIDADSIVDAALDLTGH